MSNIEMNNLGKPQIPNDDFKESSEGTFPARKETSSTKPASFYLTVEEIANELKISTSQVYLWIDSGKLEAFNLGNGSERNFYRIKRASLNRFIESKKVVLVPKKSQFGSRSSRGLVPKKNYLGPL
jgi:excisionase family DNA binding protein